MFSETDAINCLIKDLRKTDNKQDIIVEFNTSKKLKIHYTELISKTSTIFRNELEEFKKIHVETLNSWFKGNNSCKNMNDIDNYQTLSNIIINHRTYIPGFDYFFGFKNDDENYNFLLFGSCTGILAIIGNGVDLISKIRMERENYNMNLDRRFVTAVGLYFFKDGLKDGLISIDKFDEVIIDTVKSN